METNSNTDTEIIEGEATPAPETKETRVVKYSVTMAEIAKLQEEYKEVPADLTVKKNYEMVRKATGHLRGLRGDVEKRRKELKADALAWGKLVDGTAKEITEKLLAIEEPFATAKKDFDTAVEITKREAALAEERRVDGIAERIANIRALVEANISSSSAAIEAVIASIQDDPDPTNLWAMEFSDKAEDAIKSTITKLEELRVMKLQQEQAAELAAAAEAKRKQEEEEARKQREKEVEEERARLAAERQAMEAERARIAAEQKARDDAAAAEREAERAKLEEERAAIDAERARMAAEKGAEEAAKLESERAKLAAEKKPEQPAVPASPAQPEQQANTGDYAADYRAAGNAMLKFIGNKTVTKNLLDAIIAGAIANIKFTGATK